MYNNSIGGITINQELLNKINNLHHEICDFIVNYKGKDFTKTKKFKELNHEVNSLTYKYNKENKVYWDYQGTWIHDKLKEIRERVPKNLTGNAITKFVATELNKLNGLVLEEIWVNGALNYSIALVTPYTVYHYNLLRGYDYYCNLEQAKFANNGTNKSKVAFKPATLPCGFCLGATMTTNYQQLKTMYHQRRNHKLEEWYVFCDWVERLPNSELIIGVK